MLCVILSIKSIVRKSPIANLSEHALHKLTGFVKHSLLFFNMIEATVVEDTMLFHL